MPLTQQKFSCFLLVVITLLILTPCSTHDTQHICRFFPNGTEIRDPDSCRKYILCRDGVGEHRECPLSRPLYNKDTNTCVKALSNDGDYCGLSCRNHTGHFLADPKSCTGYYYCQDNATALHGDCPTKTHFNAKLQSCIHLHESACSLDNLDACSIVKDGINFKDEKNCHKYFVCKRGRMVSKTCSNQYFDVATGSCVPKSLTNCREHPRPNNVCGTPKKPLRNYFAADGATCRGYFYCSDRTEGPDPDPSWGQCGSDMFFSQEKQACLSPLLTKCREDRCEGRSLQFVNSGTLGCRHYLYCRNGVTQGPEGSCGNNFFDEELGACVNKVVTYPACSL